MSTFSFAYYILALYLESFVQQVIAMSLNGLFCLPVFVIGYDLAVVQTQKDGIGEATCCGAINMISATLSSIGVIAFTPLLADDSTSNALIVLGIEFIFLFVAMGLVLLVKNPYA